MLMIISIATVTICNQTKILRDLFKNFKTKSGEVEA